MSGLDGDHLSGWAEIRKDIVAATASLKLEDRSFSIGVRESLGEVDRVVEDAQRKLRDWRVAYRHAVAETSADMEALADYKAGMNAQFERYSALRESLADWIDRVEDPATFVTYAEGYDVLWRAQTAREAVRDAMNALTVPSTPTSARTPATTRTARAGSCS